MRPIIIRGQSQRDLAKRLVDQSPEGYCITFKEATRTDDQNAKLWPMLTDVARQVDWYGQHLTKEEWKDVFTAGLVKSKVVPGIDGGVVILGQRTSTMSKRLFSELIELIYAFGADRGVVWTERQAVPA